MIKVTTSTKEVFICELFPNNGELKKQRTKTYLAVVNLYEGPKDFDLLSAVELRNGVEPGLDGVDELCFVVFIRHFVPYEIGSW